MTANLALEKLAAFFDGDNIRGIFADLGIVALADALDDGTVLFESDFDLTGYCRSAAVAVLGSPSRTDDSEDLRQAVAVEMGTTLAAIVIGRGDGYFEDADGVPHLRTPVGDVEVTDRLVRHYWWMWTILTDDNVARRLLDAMPAEIRADAVAQAARTWDQAFGQLVPRLKGGDVR